MTITSITIGTVIPITIHQKALLVSSSVQFPFSQLPLAQVPKLPPHPLLPHVFPVQLAWQATHCPVELQVPLAQVPQLPPHPLLPQTFPVQLATQLDFRAQLPVELQ